MLPSLPDSDGELPPPLSLLVGDVSLFSLLADELSLLPSLAEELPEPVLVPCSWSPFSDPPSSPLSVLSPVEPLALSPLLP